MRRVLSYPVALAQCRRSLAEQLPDVELVAAKSTADAARVVGEQPEPGTAAVAPRLAADLYGLSILLDDVEDFPDNQTRFVAVAAAGIPAPDRPRPDEHRLLPAATTTPAACTASSASSPPATST